MPYGIRPDNCVYNTETGETVPGGCHASRSEALAHQRALMVNVYGKERTKALPPGAREILEACIHRALTLAADTLFLRGYMNREVRIALSSLIGQMLDDFGQGAEPLLQEMPVAPEDVEAIAAYSSRLAAWETFVQGWLEKFKGRDDEPGPRGSSGGGGANWGARGGQRIRGNLCRDARGRLVACGAATSAGGRGRGRQPKQDPGKVLGELGLSPEESAALAAFQQGGELDPAQAGALVAAGLVEQAADGAYRMTSAGRAALTAAERGDLGAARDALSRGREQAAKPAKGGQKPKKGRGGGQKKPEEPLASQDVLDAAATLSAGGTLDQSEADKLIRNGLARLVKGPNSQQQLVLTRLGLRAAQQGKPRPKLQPMPTSPPAPAPSAEVERRKERGLMDTFKSVIEGLFPQLKAQPTQGEEFKETWTTAYVNDLPDSAFLFIESGGEKDETGRTKPRSLRHFPYKDANGKIDLPHLRNAIARIPQSNVPGLDKSALQERARKLLENAQKQKREKDYDEKALALKGALTAFKDATGQVRWIGISSSAFEDKEEEIVSLKALEADVARSNQDGDYGPLRWWHVPGLNLGTTDFAAMHGKVLVESGVFHDPTIGMAMAKAAPNLEMSLGFRHPLDEPVLEDGKRVYKTIRRFERSLTPKGKASNRFTKFTALKEGGMSMLDAKIKELKGLVGAENAALVDELLAQAAQAQKEAEEQGIAYKGDPPTPAATLAAAPVAAEAKAGAGAPAPEAEPPAPEEGEEEEEQLTLMGDLTPDEYKTLVAEAVAPALKAALAEAIAPVQKALDINNRVESMLNEVKALVTGQSEKRKEFEDAQLSLAQALAALAGGQSEIKTTLETTVKSLQDDLTELKGEMPRAVARLPQHPFAEKGQPPTSELPRNQTSLETIVQAILSGGQTADPFKGNGAAPPGQ